MSTDESAPFEAFVPTLVWPGRRPSLAELATWHEALRDAVAQVVPLDLLGCWLLPSRGGSVLVGPPGLTADKLAIPSAEPLLTQESLFALEDRLQAAGYHATMAVPIRSEVQDVGLLVVGRFGEEPYSLADLRALHRVAAMLSTTCRRLAAQAWITPAAPVEERTAVVAAVTESLLDAIDRSRGGSDLVQLTSDAIGALLPHDRLELVAVAPAPDCWATLGDEGLRRRGIQLSPADLDRIDALVHHIGSRDICRIDNLQHLGLEWPGDDGRRVGAAEQSLCAARLEIGGEMIGWLWLGHDAPGWFRDTDEDTVRLVARLLASRVATWTARHELAGAWG